MANPDHLQILKQGVAEWNRWREENPEIEPDLKSADLKDMDLTGVDFSEAILSRADLTSSDLVQANLNCAILNQANLSYSDLSNADLTYALLYNTNFTGAVLDDTDFSDACMARTILAETELERCYGLDFLTHHGPSSIGVDTVYNSRGDIPEEFLRGCGVPEDFITYMRSLTGKAIEFYSCFISYSSKDEEFAKRLHADLQAEGVRCWFAPEDMKIGDRIRPRIDESIRLYDKLLLVLSENSVSSEWVGDEVEAALQKEAEQGGKIVLFPIRIDDAVMNVKSDWPAKVRLRRHIGDFGGWKDHDSYRKAFERLMRDLKAEAGREV